MPPSAATSRPETPAHGRLGPGEAAALREAGAAGSPGDGGAGETAPERGVERRRNHRPGAGFQPGRDGGAIGVVERVDVARGGSTDGGHPGRSPGRLAPAAFVLGFALSGFFDGILLHQILRWHHLLSALGGDLRFQVAADGWFHAGMYAVAALGLWRLWRARRALDAPGAGRAIATWGLVGFGAWHLLDAVGSHWLLGIHRIRMDAANPLAWDLAWAGAFGVLPIVAGLWVRRRGGSGGARVAAAVLAPATLGAAIWAAAPPPGGAFAAVAFAPGVPRADAFAAAASAGGGVVWADEAAGVFVVAEVGPLATAELFRRGAWFVGGTALPGGCLSWTEGR